MLSGRLDLHVAWIGILVLPYELRLRMPDYRYDVFFSYRREPQTQDWVARVVGTLRYWLRQELADDHSEIFWDYNGIDVGDRWPAALSRALRGSKCMVCLWSPAYFQSRWCVSEWESFRKRERILNLPNHGLIAPIRYHDGKLFPEAARNVQCADFAPYAYINKAFWATSPAVEFENCIKDFAKSVALIVRRAPGFRKWPVVEAEPAARAHVDLRRL
jgi:hypothetical protein